jgi:hypothetical protein
MTAAPPESGSFVFVDANADPRDDGVRKQVRSRAAFYSHQLARWRANGGDGTAAANAATSRKLPPSTARRRLTKPASEPIVRAEEVSQADGDFVFVGTEAHLFRPAASARRQVRSRAALYSHQTAPRRSRRAVENALREGPDERRDEVDGMHRRHLTFGTR